MESPGAATLTIDEFLEELAFSDRKLEFYDGRIVAFAGGSIAHGLLCQRLNALFERHRAETCHVLGSDVGVRIDRRAYLFPDLSYTCEALELSATAIVAPAALVEVISPQSSRRDRVEKLDAYRSLASLREYLVVDSRRRAVTHYLRLADGDLRERHVSAGSVEPIALASIGASLTLDELYAGILA